MESNDHHTADGTQGSAEDEPTTSELQEPSTEKDADEAPAAADASEPDDKDHEAVGIGVIGGSDTNTEEDPTDPQ